MRIARGVAWFAAAVLLAGCSGISVTTDWDPKASFDGLEHWTWAPETGTAKSDDPRLTSGLLHERIQTAVEDTMLARGFVLGGEPEFLVTYHVATDRRLESDTLYDARRYHPAGWSAGGVAETRVYEYEVGSLVIDVLSAGGKQLLWRGTASARLSESTSPDGREKRIREAVEKILAEFPPTRN